MQTITLGSNGPTVPVLGIGTWAWGDKLYWSYGKDYDENKLHESFDAAVEAGVNFFDTAEIYGLGESERLLGRFMKQTDKPVLIATKYFPLPWRFTKSAVSDALSASLKRLQLPSVDLYQVHWPFDFFLGQSALMEVLAEEYHQGRIKSVGVSNYSADQMRQAQDLLGKKGVPLAVNQVQYSLLARSIEKNGVLDAAKQLGITILAYSPLAQGLVTGKYTPENYSKPEGARRLDPRFTREGLEKLSPVINALKEIGQKYDRTPAQVALNWLIAQGSVIPIPGAKNADQAKQNAGALGWTMTQEERSHIDQLTSSI